MSLPNIFELLALLEGWRGGPALLLAAALAVLVAAALDWRLSILAMTGLYLSAGLLFVDLLDPRLAAVKVLVGLFVCLMLALTERQVNGGRAPADVAVEAQAAWRTNRRLTLRGRTIELIWPFRVAIALLAAALAALLAQWGVMQLPLLPAETQVLQTAVFTLVALGMAGMGLAVEPLQAGLGLLIFLIGFELFYAAAQPTLGAFITFAIINFVVALVVSYLTQVRFSASLMLRDQA